MPPAAFDQTSPHRNPMTMILRIKKMTAGSKRYLVLIDRAVHLLYRWRKRAQFI